MKPLSVLIDTSNYGFDQREYEFDSNPAVEEGNGRAERPANSLE